MSEWTEWPLDPEPTPVRRGPGRVIAGVVAVVAVVAAGVFAATALSGNGNSPEDPVRAMFEAAQQGDVLGVLEQLEPGERHAVRDSLVDLTEELNRLGVLDGASLSHITGIDLKISDLAFESTKVSEDIADVKITGGRSTYRIDATKLPLGDFVRSLAGDTLDELSTSGSDSLKSDSADDVVTTVKRDGRWYVSLGYSIAESARRDAKTSFADLGTGVPARGADSPDGAVRSFLTAMSGLDLRRIIELLPPDEMGALHDYAGLFIADAEKDLPEVRDAFTISFPTLELSADTSGDQSLVKITKVAVDADLGGMAFSYKDGCADFTPPDGEPQHVCTGADPTEFLRTMGIGANLQPPKLSFADKHANIGIIATRVDGKWYVSPTRTMLGALVAQLELVQRSDLDALRTYVSDLMESFGAAFTTSVESTTAGDY